MLTLLSAIFLPIRASFRQVFDRLYARHEDRKIRLAEARQKEKEEQQFDFRPRLELSQTGPAAEASKRLHEGVAKKRQAREDLQQKYDEEFRLLHPFRPELQAAEKPWQNREEWLQDQEEWRRKRNERRAGKLQEKLDEEAQYLSSRNLHRGAQADPEAVGRRLFLAAKKREVQLQKLRAKHLAEEDEAVVNSLHRKLDKSAEAAEKVGRVVDRLYGQDRQEREQRQEQRRMKKRLAERAETSLLEAMSVHSPVDLPCDGLFQDIRDKTSLKLEQELRDLRAALMDLRSRALNADPAALRRFAANQASGKADKPPQAKAPGAGYGTRSHSPARWERDPAPRPPPRAASARRQPSSAPTLPLTPRARAPPATARRDASPARTPRSPSQAKQLKAPGSSASPRRPPDARPGTTASKSVGRLEAAPRAAKTSRPAKTEPPRRQMERKPPARNTDQEAEKSGEAPTEFDPGQELAATKIQSRVRGKHARREVEGKREARAAKAGQDSSEDVEEMDPSPSSGGFDREQELAATKIQSRIRGKHARREVEGKRQAARAARARQDSEDVEEMDPSPSSGGFDREQELAATKIQSRIRGKHARREVEGKRQAARAARARQDSEDVEEMDPSPSSGGFDREQELAATKIQSRIRGKQARREVEKKRQAEPEALAEDGKASDQRPGAPSHEQELAATKIQSQVRGKQARREVQLRKQKTWVPLDETPSSVSPSADREQELAATKIQSRVRGKQARREVEKRREARRSESDEDSGDVGNTLEWHAALQALVGRQPAAGRG
ncbi:unnamed protein product [Symbiodinium sp. CCMP2456]|nr:unnamed protein product [Symbiodinium sp. CCMP2456]